MHVFPASPRTRSSAVILLFSISDHSWKPQVILMFKLLAINMLLKLVRFSTSEQCLFSLDLIAHTSICFILKLSLPSILYGQRQIVS